MEESKKRTLAKTITWRIFASLITMGLVFFFTGEWILSLGVGVTEVFIKMLGYYIHERTWNKVKWEAEKNE